MADAKNVSYAKSGVALKSIPKKGENVNLFLRPGDELNLGVDLSSAKFQLVGADLIATLPGGGQITFVSMGMMAFEDDSPIIRAAGARLDVGDLLNRVGSVQEAPKDALLVSGTYLWTPSKKRKKRSPPQKRSRKSMNTTPFL